MKEFLKQVFVFWYGNDLRQSFIIKYEEQLNLLKQRHKLTRIESYFDTEEMIKKDRELWKKLNQHFK